jgi:hypothetical protein
MEENQRKLLASAAPECDWVRATDTLPITRTVKNVIHVQDHY